MLPRHDRGDTQDDDDERTAPVLSRARQAARGRLERLVEEVVARHAAEQSAAADRRAAALTAELRATRAQLEGALVGLQVRARRDLHLATEVQAAASSARFAVAEMPTVRAFAHPDETRRHAAELVSVDGMVLEFGVASGHTLRLLTECLPGRYAAGFDVFTGLPEDWRTGFPAGTFAQPALPEVPGAELVVGLFADTLPGFLAAHPGPVALLHLDADLYSATATVLGLLGERLVPGSVVLFDEYLNHPGWERGEHRAWTEFTAGTGVTFRYEGYSRDNEQLVLTVTGSEQDR